MLNTYMHAGMHTYRQTGKSHNKITQISIVVLMIVATIQTWSQTVQPKTLIFSTSSCFNPTLTPNNLPSQGPI